MSSYNKTDVAAPFGGFKKSGFGKDLGQEALNEYLKTKTITFEFSLWLTSQTTTTFLTQLPFTTDNANTVVTVPFS